MSPIDQSTIHVETWTMPSGKVKKQLVAEGDSEDPGTFIFEYGVKPKNEKRVHGVGKIVDINVEDKLWPEIANSRPMPLHGVWKKVKEA